MTVVRIKMDKEGLIDFQAIAEVIGVHRGDVLAHDPSSGNTIYTTETLSEQPTFWLTRLLRDEQGELYCTPATCLDEVHVVDAEPS